MKKEGKKKCHIVFYCKCEQCLELFKTVQKKKYCGIQCRRKSYWERNKERLYKYEKKQKK